MFAARRSNYDLIMLTETWLSDINDLVPILGQMNSTYYFVRCDRAQKRGGGVVVLIKRSIAFEVVWCESYPNAFEIISCDLKLLQSTVRTIVVYRTPSCTTSGTIQLIKALSDLTAFEGQCIINGDFNFPDIDWVKVPLHATSFTSQMFLNFCNSNMLVQKVHKPTRGSHTLDLVLCSDTKLIRDVLVSAPTGSSDHNSLSYNVETFINPIYFRLRRSFHKAPYDFICRYLCSLDWRFILETLPDINDKYEFFLSILHASIQEFVPLERQVLNRGNIPPHLSKLFEIKEKAWLDYQKNPCLQASERFRLIKTKFDRLIKKYNSYIERKLLDNPKKCSLYKLLNSRLKQSTKIPTLVDDEGNSAVSDFEKASMLAAHFKKSYSIEADNESWSELAFSTQSASPDSFVWFHKEDIFKHLSNLPLSYTTTPDEIPAYFIKKVAVALVAPLEHIFNFSYMHSEIPNRWKHAFVTPIPKKPPHGLVSNYRPISITSVFSRIFEKILKVALVNHIETHEVIPKNQYGFRVGRSTETLMLSTLDDWTKSLDDNTDVDVVFFDFSKAFDKVPFKELIFKLQIFGIHPRIVKWVKNFITNRSFQVKVNDKFSRTYSITSGVPQGGVLSPILFIIYTSDLPVLVERRGVKCKMFADDIKVYKNITSEEDHLALQCAVSDVADWSDRWKLPISAQKTRVFHLGNSNSVKHIYSLGGCNLLSENSLRDLGFILDKKLSFSEHCETIAKKAERVTYNIFRALSTNSKTHLLLAYKSYVRPILEYGTTVFNPHLKRCIQRLESVQNSYTRKLWLRLNGYDYTSIPSAPDRNKIFELESLAIRRKRNDLIMIFKMMTGKVALPLTELYTVHHSTTRGCRSKIHYSTAKSCVRASFFTQRAGSEFLMFTKKHTLPSSINQYKKLVGSYLKTR